MDNSFQKGLKEFKSGNIDKAEELFHQAVEEDDQNHKAWNALGIVLKKSGEIDEAIICFKNALLLDPDNNTYSKNLSIAETPSSKPKIKQINTTPPKIEQKERKDPFNPVLLSIFFPGLGQVYNGMGGYAGLLWGIICSIGYFIFFIPGLLIHLYLIYDSYKVRKSMNSGELEPHNGNKTEYLKYFLPFILIVGFVIIAAIFSYIMLGAGFFATQKPNEVTYSGIKTQNSDNLKIYQNSELKYQLKYPNTWTIKSVPKDYSNFESIIIRSSSGEMINIKAGAISSSSYMAMIDDLDNITDAEIMELIYRSGKMEEPSQIIETLTFQGKNAILLKNLQNIEGRDSINVVSNKIDYMIFYQSPLSSEAQKIIDSITFTN